MNIIEMNDYCKKVYAEYADTYDNDWKGEYEFIGIRFEDKDRNVGDVITDKSRNNVDREDERDFPEYGTDEYSEMEELDGVSAWNLSKYEFPRDDDKEKDCSLKFESLHCYILVSNEISYTDNTVIDDGEIVMENALVVAKVF